MQEAGEEWGGGGWGEELAPENQGAQTFPGPAPKREGLYHPQLFLKQTSKALGSEEVGGGIFSGQPVRHTR